MKTTRTGQALPMAVPRSTRKGNLCLTLVVALLLAACSTASPGASSSSSPVAPVAPTSAPSVAPSTSDPLTGTWVTANITESQFVHAYVAAGGSEKDGHEVFGAQDFRVIMLQFQDGVFREYGSADGVPTGLANYGRYTIKSDGTFTLRSGSCTETFGYELTGDVLQLSYLPPFCPDDGRPIGQTLYTSFPFTRSH
jgi:hypothetical protein